MGHITSKTIYYSQLEDFSHLANMLTYFKKLQKRSIKQLDPKEENYIKFMSSFYNWVPIPIGVKGNALALALEMQMFNAAHYLIEHSKELKMNVEGVIAIDSSENITVEQIFELAATFYNPEEKMKELRDLMLHSESELDKKQYQELLIIEQDNLEAFNNLKLIYGYEKSSESNSMRKA